MKWRTVAWLVLGAIGFRFLRGRLSRRESRPREGLAEHTVEIERPIEEVWEFVVDPANGAAWQTTLAESRQLTDGPMELGTKVKEVRQFLGRRIESTWEVTEWEPMRRSSIRTVSGPVPFAGTYLLDSRNGSTRFTMRIESHEASGFFRLAEPVLTRIVQREMEANAGHVKDLLESGGPRREEV